MKEEALIKKFYSDQLSNENILGTSKNIDKENKIDDNEDKKDI